MPCTVNWYSCLFNMEECLAAAPGLSDHKFLQQEPELPWSSLKTSGLTGSADVDDAAESGSVGPRTKYRRLRFSCGR